MAQYVEFKSEGIWQHFLREKNGQTAKYKICKTARTIGGSTKALMFSKKIFSVPCFYFLISISLGAVSHAHTHTPTNPNAQ